MGHREKPRRTGLRKTITRKKHEGTLLRTPSGCWTEVVTGLGPWGCVPVRLVVAGSPRVSQATLKLMGVKAPCSACSCSRISEK